MANRAELKALVKSVIYDNVLRKITATKHQDLELEILDNILTKEDDVVDNFESLETTKAASARTVNELHNKTPKIGKYQVNTAWLNSSTHLEGEYDISLFNAAQTLFGYYYFKFKVQYINLGTEYIHTLITRDGKTYRRASVLGDWPDFEEVVVSSSGGGDVTADSVNTAFGKFTEHTNISDSDLLIGAGKKKWSFANIKEQLTGLFAAKTHNHTKSDISDFPALAAVATSGSYNDLSDRPNLGIFDDIIKIQHFNNLLGVMAEGDITYYNQSLTRYEGGVQVSIPFSADIYINDDSISDGYGKLYRYSGSDLVIVGDGLVLGETISTAYRGDRGKMAYDHSQAAHAPAHAQANVIETVKVNGVALTPDENKAVDVIAAVGQLTLQSAPSTDSIQPSFDKDIYYTVNTGSSSILIDTFTNLPTFSTTKLIEVLNSRASSMSITFRTSDLIYNGITFSFVNFSPAILNIPSWKRSEISYLFKFINSTTCIVEIMYSIQP